MIASTESENRGVEISDLITLAQAADELPRRRRGRKTSVSTLYRWTTSGCRGIRLRYSQCGATRVTTRQWMAEFFEALAGPADNALAISPAGTRPLPPRTRTAAEGRKAAEAAGKKLEKAWAGI